MQQGNLNLAKAHFSQYDETTLDKLAINGEVPTWLMGSFVSNGPGQFEVGATFKIDLKKIIVVNL